MQVKGNFLYNLNPLQINIGDLNDQVVRECPVWSGMGSSSAPVFSVEVRK